MTLSPETIIRSHCLSIGQRDIAALSRGLAEDIEFVNVGYGICRGRQAVIDHYQAEDGVWSMFEYVDFRIRNLGVTGNRVYTERVDVLSRGGILARLPVLGIFEIEHGLIRHWRDYSDMGMVRRLLGGEVVSAEKGFPEGTELV